MKVKTIINLICSFLITFAFYNIFDLESGNIMTLVLFVFAYGLVSGAAIGKNLRGRVSEVLGAIYAILYSLGIYDTITKDLSSRLFRLVYTLFTIAGLYLTFSRLTAVVFDRCIGDGARTAKPEGEKFPFRLMGIYFVIFLIPVIPAFLMNFPGVMTPDSINQWEQAMGILPLDDHHPWVHTMTMKLFGYPFYKVFGIYGGIAGAVTGQLLLVGISLSYSLASLKQLGVGGKIRWAVLLCFVLYPYHAIYTVTIWKDILFSSALLVMTITLFRLSYRLGVGDMIIMLLSGTVMCLFRHNGFYGFLFFALILWIVTGVGYIRHGRIGKSLLAKNIITIAIICIVLLVKGPVMSAVGVEPGKFPFKIALPLQQIGRVVYENRELEAEESELITEINEIDYIRENYRPGGADNMLQWAVYGDYYKIQENPWTYLKLYAKLGMRYPLDYAAAFIDQTRGYFYPMNPEQTVYFGILQDNKYNLETRPLTGPIKGNRLIKINEILTKLYTMFPVYGVLYSCGSAFWLLLLSMGALVIKKDYDRILSCMPLFGVALTVFVATPLVADLRYGYALILILPYIMAIAFGETNGSEYQTK